MLLSCDSDWSLMAVTSDALLHVWDLRLSKRLISESLAPLMPNTSPSETSPPRLDLVSASFTRKGAPLLTLGDMSCFLFHSSMAAWLRVAHDGFPASQFSSSMSTITPAQQDADLAVLQAAVAKGKSTGAHFVKSAASLLSR